MYRIIAKSTHHNVIYPEGTVVKMRTYDDKEKLDKELNKLREQQRKLNGWENMTWEFTYEEVSG